MSKKLTTETFTEKATIKHSDKYDYSEVNYINNFTKVTIICNIHGIFMQEPKSHLIGRGCPDCCQNKRLGSIKFIKQSNKIHANKYDYSKVKYINNYTKVKIICPEHGIFKQTPSNHLMGKGCHECSGNKKLTTNKFIKKSRIVHGNKYNYSNSEYKGTHIKVKIICPDHGLFEQIPGQHMRGANCPKCAKKISAKKRLLSNEDFVSRAIVVHGNEFDYSMSEYKKSNIKVKIICRKHGIFEQTPVSHLGGKGCLLCARELNAEKRTRTTDEFIELSRLAHGDKFDYSMVNYIGCFDLVCIICPKHGKFVQKPSDHIMGKGCSICNESHGEKRIAKFLININEPFERLKIFDDCISPKGRKYEFDFWSEKRKLIIEFDGAQHRVPVIYFTKNKTMKEAIENLKIQKENDANKDKYTKDKGYTTIRIQEINQIDKILDEYFKLNK